jgi:hypothetical protein
MIPIPQAESGSYGITIILPQQQNLWVLTLVSSGNVSFLVSAAHVFDPLARKNDLCIYVATSKLHHLSGSVFLTPMVDNNWDDDLLDIGVLRLLPVASPPYPEVGKEAIAIDALLSLSLPRGQKHYALVGFPESRTKVYQPGRFMRSEPSAVQNVSASEKEYRSIGRNEQDHIVVRFDPRKVSWPHQPGKASHAFPDPHGMSGSPLCWIDRPEAGDSTSSTHRWCGQ